MDKLIIIGTIVKPQGIKGEVKVVPYTDDATRFNSYKAVNISGTEYAVEDVRVNNNDVYLKLNGINDRNAAELLRGKDIAVLRGRISKPRAGRYYISDLIGCKVYSEEIELGELFDILQHGAADVYVVATDKGNLMFPALKDLIIDVDIQAKKIIVSGKRLDEVAVYED